MRGEKYKDSGDIFPARQIRNAQAKSWRVVFNWSGLSSDSSLPQYTRNCEDCQGNCAKSSIATAHNIFNVYCSTSTFCFVVDIYLCLSSVITRLINFVCRKTMLMPFTRAMAFYRRTVALPKLLLTLAFALLGPRQKSCIVWETRWRPERQPLKLVSVPRWRSKAGWCVGGQGGGYDSKGYIEAAIEVRNRAW